MYKGIISSGSITGRIVGILGEDSFLSTPTTKNLDYPQRYEWSYPVNEAYLGVVVWVKNPINTTYILDMHTSTALIKQSKIF